jgi:hypothetical protein
LLYCLKYELYELCHVIKILRASASPRQQKVAEEIDFFSFQDGVSVMSSKRPRLLVLGNRTRHPAIAGRVALEHQSLRAVRPCLSEAEVTA